MTQVKRLIGHLDNDSLESSIHEEVYGSSYIVEG